MDVQRWRTWRYITGDTVISTSYKPSLRPTSDLIITDAEAVAILPLVVGADNATSGMRFVGWMRESGIGIMLGSVTAVACSMTCDENPADATDPKRSAWPAGGTFRFVDTLTSPTLAVSALSPAGTSNKPGLIRVGLYGCNALEIEVDNTSGGATASGYLWRPLSGTFK